MSPYRAVLAAACAALLATGIDGAHADGPVTPTVVAGGALDPSSIIRPGRSIGALRLGMTRAQVEAHTGSPYNEASDAPFWTWGPSGSFILSVSFDANRADVLVTYVAGQRVLTTAGPRLGQALPTFDRGLGRVYRRATGRCGHGRCSYDLVRKTGARERLVLLLSSDGRRVDGARITMSANAPR